jgi:hypothetical protein
VCVSLIGRRVARSEAAARDGVHESWASEAGTQFTCFTGTKVQILLLRGTGCTSRGRRKQNTQFTCFTGTNVQILLLREMGCTSHWASEAGVCQNLYVGTSIASKLST